MVVVETFKSKYLRMTHEIGVDSMGKSTYATKSYPNVDESATNQKIWDTALALQSLSEKNLVSIETQENNILDE